ncbi:MAG: hypothetical protein SGI99_12835 [Pseudomonadota bacterium]|nr:hypothetical protein [Pseudomonadota bacterium]
MEEDADIATRHSGTAVMAEALATDEISAEKRVVRYFVILLLTVS